MITGIMSSGRYITVANGSGTTLPYLTSTSSDPAMGDVRVVNGQLACWTGSGWQPILGSYPSVGLTGEAEVLLDWAREHKNKEQHREQLIKDNPALQKAYEAIKRAEENFDILEKFVENDKNAGEEVQSSP